MAASVKLAVKVVPGAAADSVVGWLGDALKLRVQALPQDGKANDAVIRLIAAALDVEKSRVTITHGHASPRKTLEIAGLSDEELQRRLPA